MGKHLNALRHGIYSKNKILPGERHEDFMTLLNGIRLDLRPQGTMQDATASNIAGLFWRRRRLGPLFLFNVNAQVRPEAEKSGKRRVEKEREKVSLTTEVVDLFEALASLADESKKNNVSLAKAGANLRYVLRKLEKLRPTIVAATKFVDEGKQIDRAFKRFRLACEQDARLAAQVTKEMQSMIVLKEYDRQYGQDSIVNLLPRDPAISRDNATEVGASDQ